MIWGDDCSRVGVLLALDTTMWVEADMAGLEGERRFYTFSGKGTVWSFTQVCRDHAPARFVEQAPYYVAIVKFKEGLKITAQLTDLDPKEEVYIGMPVEMVTRRLYEDGDERGMLVYGYMFRPLIERR
jgi:uncharacterized protein